MSSLLTFTARLLRGNYAYVQARVRAKKAKLIPEDQWPKILAMDIHGVARLLQEGAYKQEVDELASRMSGARLVEAATRLHLVRTYNAIESYCSGELAALLTLYLQRYDVYNVKTILRGRLAGVPRDEIADQLIPAGVLHADTFDELLRLDEVDEIAKRLQTTPYGDLLAESAGRELGASLAKLENDLDKRYYTGLVKGVEPNTAPKRAFLSYLTREIDVVNLKTLLRLRGDREVEVDAYLVPGGHEVTLDVGRRLARASDDELIAEVERMRVGRGLGAALRESLSTGNLHPALTALDKELLKASSGFAHRYPLSILPVVDYVLRKRQEVDRLRIVALGKERKVREDVLHELVVIR
ncbi:MAG: ATP synthase A1 subunit C [Methanobacteriota archaeon]